MSQPGWFPDPAGNPGHFRYWDGQNWSATTTTNPQSPAQATGQQSRRRPLVWIVGVVVLTVVVVLIVRSLGGGGGRPVAEDTDTSTPTVSAWDETSSATPEPSDPNPSGGTVVSCPDQFGDTSGRGEENGRYYGGGLSYAAIPGWEDTNGWGVDWASDRAGQRDRVSGSWVSIAVVGEVDKESFVNPQQAARGLLSCLASSFYYRDITSRVDVSSQAVTVDGHQGWKAVSEIHVDNVPGVQGDVIQVAVLDIGHDGMLSIMITEAPIGDTTRLGLADAAVASLKVEG